MLIIVTVISGCGPKKPELIKKTGLTLEDCLTESTHRTDKYHVVNKGETLYRLSKIYGVSIEELVQTNNIEDHTKLKIGKILLIPGAMQTSLFNWPLNGKITSRFGKRRNRFHHGLDISAKNGTPIKSVSDGIVIISRNKLNGYSNYGQIVIIEHINGIQSLYAHNRVNLVEEGRCVRQGDDIAEVGSSGNATGNHLHLEIRKNGKPVNPLNYLK